MAVTSEPGGFMVMWFYVKEHLKAQPAVVLVLKRLRRWGNSLKSHPTDWWSHRLNVGPLGTSWGSNVGPLGTR